MKTLLTTLLVGCLSRSALAETYIRIPIEQARRSTPVIALVRVTRIRPGSGRFPRTLAGSVVVRLWKGREHVQWVEGQPTIEFGRAIAASGDALEIGRLYLIHLRKARSFDPLPFRAAWTPAHIFEAQAFDLGRGWHPENGRWVEDGCASCFWYP